MGDVTEDVLGFIEHWHRRAAYVPNGGDTVPGAFFVIDFGMPSVEVYTHKWDPDRSDYERVGNPVQWAPVPGYYGEPSLLAALQVASSEAERILREEGRWGR